MPRKFKDYRNPAVEAAVAQFMAQQKGGDPRQLLSEQEARKRAEIDYAYARREARNSHSPTIMSKKR